MTPLLVAAAFAVALLESPQEKPAPSNAGLHIVVVAGEDAVNIIQQKTAVAPIVEVRDRNNQPVAGVVVTFTVGQNASFGGASTLSLTTNAAGRAAVAGMTPTGAGSVQINVAAAFQGQTATATITQSNLVTAAQAASTSGASTGAGSGAGSGGGIGTGQIVAIGAGVAAAGAGVVLAGSKEEETAELPPEIGAIRIEPSIAALATPVQFLVDDGGDAEPMVMWDFGDGARSTAVSILSNETVSHTYMSVGTFTVTVTVTNSRGQATSRQASVTIKSLTGRWTIDVGGFVDFVQSGTALVGTYTTGSTATSGTLIGVVGPGEVPGFVNFAPGVEFTVTANNRQQFRFVGSVANGTSVNGITGGFNTSTGLTVWRLTRQ